VSLEGSASDRFRLPGSALELNQAKKFHLTYCPPPTSGTPKPKRVRYQTLLKQPLRLLPSAQGSLARAVISEHPPTSTLLGGGAFAPMVVKLAATPFCRIPSKGTAKKTQIARAAVVVALSHNGGHQHCRSRLQQLHRCIKSLGGSLARHHSRDGIDNSNCGIPQQQTDIVALCPRSPPLLPLQDCGLDYRCPSWRGSGGSPLNGCTPVSGYSSSLTPKMRLMAPDT
jgi:hypothetical protein